MAQRVKVVLEDDLDGGLGDETVAFNLDGVGYEIDLSAKNAEKLRKALTPWTSKARRVGGRRKRGSAQVERGGAAEIRAWAAGNGIEVNARGRVPAEVRDAYANSRR